MSILFSFRCSQFPRTSRLALHVLFAVRWASVASERPATTHHLVDLIVCHNYGTVLSIQDCVCKSLIATSMISLASFRLPFPMAMRAAPRSSRMKSILPPSSSAAAFCDSVTYQFTGVFAICQAIILQNLFEPPIYYRGHFSVGNFP